MLAVLAQRVGMKTAILDGDITGPSIPKIFGIQERAQSSDLGIFPVKSGTGIRIMSINLLLENTTDPVIWRGPLIGNMVKQFWTDVIWDETDIMFIDMPPGTGDVPLTVFQSIPIDGIVVVTSPQELVSMIVTKAVNMAKKMNIPVIGLIENMSFVKCPDCGREIKVFGESKLEDVAKDFNIEVLGKIPIDSRLATACDRGMIELFDGSWLDYASEKIRMLVAGGDNA
jgi:Mrp family chromosome partitioning ATPase